MLAKVTCENGTKIVEISRAELCRVQQEKYTIFIVAVLGMFSLFMSSLSIYYKFQKAIKIWLYTHRCCLSFVTEEELDQDKQYDAFISFSHKDEDFVMEHLVPGLENGNNRYTLCLHYRNWLAGEFIPTHIARSVEQSRRTIIVLSPNFLKSGWSRLEFCAAHQQALSERRVRVIIVMYEDLGPDDEVDAELRAYLTMNTYVKWGDPWFWDKLIYAMPHRS